MVDLEISNKKLIDDIQKKLILRLDRKITQQETLDLCLKYSAKNFEEILALASSTPMLIPERAEKIIKRFEKFKDTPYDQNATFNNPDDNDIYLKEALGTVDMVRFLHQLDLGSGDYTKERKHWLTEQKVDDVIKEIK